MSLIEPNTAGRARARLSQNWLHISVASTLKSQGDHQRVIAGLIERELPTMHQQRPSVGGLQLNRATHETFDRIGACCFVNGGGIDG
jgi:hypothetical protein